MNYSILTIPPFDKQIKRLAKKYPYLKAEIAQLITELKSEPNKGTSIGNDCFKIRYQYHPKERENQVVPG